MENFVDGYFYNSTNAFGGVPLWWENIRVSSFEFMFTVGGRKVILLQ